jgi:DNA repair exonuclease SbcCD ATPase subunit
MPNLSLFISRIARNKWYREYRKRKAAKYRKYQREYNKKWRKKNGYEIEVKSQKKYPRKQKARRLMHKALRQGVLKREPCVVCGKKNSQGHHVNYNKPLLVKWLCPLHHAQEHKK